MGNKGDNNNTNRGQKSNQDLSGYVGFGGMKEYLDDDDDSVDMIY